MTGDRTICVLTVIFPSFSFRLSPSLPSQTVKNVNKQVWVFLGSATIVAASAYPVFSKDTRPGHDIFSSEKPEVIREAQEEKRKEYRQLIKERRAKLAEDKAEAEAYAAASTQSSTTSTSTRSDGPSK